MNKDKQEPAIDAPKASVSQWNPKSIDGLADHQKVVVRCDDMRDMRIELPPGHETCRGQYAYVELNVGELRRQLAKLGK